MCIFCDNVIPIIRMEIESTHFLGSYLHFFSIFFDYKAIKEYIISDDKAIQLSIFTTLIYHDPVIYDWLGLHLRRFKSRELAIIQLLYKWDCFRECLTIERFTEYIISRWWFDDANCTELVMEALTHHHPIQLIEDRLKYYWEISDHISHQKQLRRRWDETIN